VTAVEKEIISIAILCFPYLLISGRRLKILPLIPVTILTTPVLRKCAAWLAIVNRKS
jgi:hypothetical protein